MHTWRIYRLPGSRKLWHIDSGKNTAVFNVVGFRAFVPTEAVDKPCGTCQPRAWIEVKADGVDLHVISGIAVFSHSADPVNTLGTIAVMDAAEKQAKEEIKLEEFFLNENKEERPE